MTVEETIGDLQLHQHGDIFLTDAFLNHGYRGVTLRQLNACHLCLQVETLSDITTADGCYLTHSAQQGLWDATRPLYHQWPTQADPGPRAWHTWQHALAVIFCGGYLHHGLA